jgi:hypothetical protein
VNDLRAAASARETGVRVDRIAEARNVAKEHMGSDAIVTSAQPGKSYSGKIIGILGGPASPDRSAIQAVSDNHAILHDIKNISANANLKIGDEAAFDVDDRGESISKGIGAQQNGKNNERAREGMRR